MENISTCPICYEELNEDNKIILPNCDHEFCEECFIEWIAINETCPLDRSNLNITFDDFLSKLLLSENKEFYKSMLLYFKSLPPLLTSSCLTIKHLQNLSNNIGKLEENRFSNSHFLIEFEKICEIINQCNGEDIINFTKKYFNYFKPHPDPIYKNEAEYRMNEFNNINFSRYARKKDLAGVASSLLRYFGQKMDHLKLRFNETAIDRNEKVGILKNVLQVLKDVYIGFLEPNKYSLNQYFPELIINKELIC